jgi:N-acetylglucosaminyl-diphospho-decaprenol L-rhamnosyltransferase
LLRTLDLLAALPERPPVCVVDNASTDGTAGAVRHRHRDVLVIELPENMGAAARNVGAAALETPHVAFNDDDSWWEPRRAAQTFAAHPRLALLAAHVLVGPDQHVDPTCVEMEASPLPRNGAPGPAVLGFLACGAVVRRSAFLEAGGFEPRFGVGGEEHLLAVDLAAAGWDLAYVPAVRAQHRPAPSADRGHRARRQLRNDFWSAWLRRPAPAALRQTARLLSPADRATWSAFGAAVRGLPWVLRRRHVVPPDVERGIAALN